MDSSYQSNSKTLIVARDFIEFILLNRLPSFQALGTVVMLHSKNCTTLIIVHASDSWEVLCCVLLLNLLTSFSDVKSPLHLTLYGDRLMPQTQCYEDSLSDRDWPMMPSSL